VELLYRAINDWRQKELEFIESNRWGPDRKAALAQVAEMELNLLADLEKAKSKIKKGLKEKVIEKAFRKVNQPHSRSSVPVVVPLCSARKIIINSKENGLNCGSRWVIRHVP